MVGSGATVRRIWLLLTESRAGQIARKGVEREVAGEGVGEISGVGEENVGAGAEVSEVGDGDVAVEGEIAGEAEGRGGEDVDEIVACGRVGISQVEMKDGAREGVEVSEDIEGAGGVVGSGKDGTGDIEMSGEIAGGGEARRGWTG